MAALVMSQSNGHAGAAIGGLFNGLAFFLVMRLPSRTNYIVKIQANGGRVVKVEAQADHIIADHLRRDCPPGSISYTFIDDALKMGTLPDANNHLAGRPTGTARDVSSLVPVKTTRTPFTAEDDRMLWHWVERAKTDGAMVRGNTIYKQLEAVNPRHTWQAWRDRYVKRLMDKPPVGTQVAAPANPPPSPPEVSEAQMAEARRHPSPDSPRKRKATPSSGSEENVARQLTDGAVDESAQDYEEEASVDEREQYQQDFDSLMRNADDILVIDEALVDTAWNAWASQHPHRTAREWQTVWEEDVLPEYKARRRAAKRRKQESAEFEDTADEPTQTSNHPTTRSGDRAGDLQDVDILTNITYASIEPPSTKRTRIVSHEISRGDSANNTRSNQDLQAVTDMPKRNKDIGSRLRQEASGLTDESDNNSQQRDSDLDTSEANRAADSQLRRESLEIPDHEIDQDADDALGYDGDGEITISTHLIEDGEVEDGLPGEEIIDLDADVGDSLTEADLAAPRVEHGIKSLGGVDLPEHDEMRDRSEFADSLKELLQQRKRNTQDDVIDLTAESVEQKQESSADSPALPLSSQAEMDSAIASTLQWPLSPQQTRNGPLVGPSQSRTRTLPPGMQVDYPRLPEVDAIVGKKALSGNAHGLAGRSHISSRVEYVNEEEDDIQSQAEIEILHDQYPQIGGNTQETPIGRPTTPKARMSSASVPSGIQIAKAKGELGSASGDLDDDEEIEEDEYALDLSVAEPEGGFVVTSPPYAARRFDQIELAEQQRDFLPRTQQHAPLQKVEQGQDTVGPIAESSPAFSGGLEEDEEDAYHSDQDQRANQHVRGVKTQDILNAETQQPDLDVPLPPDSLPSSPSQEPTSPPNLAIPSIDPSPSTETPRPRTTNRSAPPPPAPTPPPLPHPPPLLNSPSSLEAFIHQMHLDHRIPEAQVLQALKRTSLRPDLAELVLLEQEAGRGVPTDVAGVWTEDDDAVLEGGNAVRLEELVRRKGGWEAVEGRMEFWREWRALD